MSDRPQALARTSHTHLFPGAELTVDQPEHDAARPRALDIVFCDGAETTAEILVDDATGTELLAVNPYTTVAGAAIPNKMWQIKQWQHLPDGSVRLRLGGRLPFSVR